MEKEEPNKKQETAKKEKVDHAASLASEYLINKEKYDFETTDEMRDFFWID